MHVHCHCTSNPTCRYWNMFPVANVHNRYQCLWPSFPYMYCRVAKAVCSAFHVCELQGICNANVMKCNKFFNFVAQATVFHHRLKYVQTCSYYVYGSQIHYQCQWSQLHDAIAENAYSTPVAYTTIQGGLPTSNLATVIDCCMSKVCRSIPGRMSNYISNTLFSDTWYNFPM